MSCGLNAISDTYCFKRKEAFLIFIIPRTKKKGLGSVGGCKDVILPTCVGSFGAVHIDSLSCQTFLAQVSNTDTGVQ
jgi:hypothetical protein